MHFLLMALSFAAHAQDPAPPAPVQSNADLTLSLTSADGKTKTGHVKRIERGEDIYGDKGWVDDEKAMLFYVESDKEYIKITWDKVKKVTIKVVDAKDMSCVYSSDFNPWMYECYVKLSAALTTKDGKRYTADSGHKWRFIFDDGSETELWLKKHYAREQDAEKVEMGQVGENRTLYEKLQNRLREEIKTSLITGISVK
jgi:hypothetical protein